MVVGGKVCYINWRSSAQPHLRNCYMGPSPVYGDFPCEGKSLATHAKPSRHGYRGDALGCVLLVDWAVHMLVGELVMWDVCSALC